MSWVEFHLVLTLAVTADPEATGMEKEWSPSPNIEIPPSDWEYELVYVTVENSQGPISLWDCLEFCWCSSVVVKPISRG